MNKLAVSLITGDSYRDEEVKKLLVSLEGVADHIYVAYNGKKSKLKWQKWTKTPITYKKFEWEDDFAVARQQSFDMVPKDEYDWIMWLDTDDVFVVEEGHLHGMDAMFNSIDPYTQGIYLRYDYAVDPDSGEVVVQQWRERIFSTKTKVIWTHPIHEAAHLPPGSQYARREHAYVIHQRQPKEDRGARDRNRRIIAKTLRKEPDNPRMQFYFANELMAEAHEMEPSKARNDVADASILAFRKFISLVDNESDDMYLAQQRVGELYLMKGQYNTAIDAFLQAIKVYPDWPDAYIGIARSCMEIEDWPRCKAFINLALNLPEVKTHSAITPLTYRYTPYLLRGMANEGLELYNDAKNDYEKALSIWSPPGNMIQERMEELDRKAAVAPKDKDERKQLRGSRPEKSIAFVTAPLPESWHPRLEAESGAGGAETCIMRLAPRFAADGWRVAVFGTPGDHVGIDENGVEWWNSNDFLSNERFKVVVASRVPEIFTADVNAEKKILWMHDVNVGPRLYPLRERVDTIVGLSNWHVQHMSRLYDIPKDNFTVIRNGIELDLYDLNKRDDTGDELRFIWSSSPDRGLSTLISLWPGIKNAFPNSVLNIFYGWNIIDKIIEQGGNRAGYLLSLKIEILTNIEAFGGEEGGIFQHGRVPQTELAKWQLKSHIWPYPTDFMETSCITALENQAAGVIPVVSDLAALKESVAMPSLRISGWPLNKDYQNRYLERLFQVVESEPHQVHEMRQVGRKLAELHSWDNSYAQWQKLING